MRARSAPKDQPAAALLKVGRWKSRPRSDPISGLQVTSKQKHNQITADFGLRPAIRCISGPILRQTTFADRFCHLVIGQLPKIRKMIFAELLSYRAHTVIVYSSSCHSSTFNQSFLPLVARTCDQPTRACRRYKSSHLPPPSRLLFLLPSFIHDSFHTTSYTLRFISLIFNTHQSTLFAQISHNASQSC